MKAWKAIYRIESDDFEILFLFPLVSLDYLACPQQLHIEKYAHDPEVPTYFFTYIHLVLNQIKLLSNS
jgi:hypothetical protein